MDPIENSSIQSIEGSNHLLKPPSTLWTRLKGLVTRPIVVDRIGPEETRRRQQNAKDAAWLIVKRKIVWRVVSCFLDADGMQRIILKRWIEGEPRAYIEDADDLEFEDPEDRESKIELDKRQEIGLVRHPSKNRDYARNLKYISFVQVVDLPGLTLSKGDRVQFWEPSSNRWRDGRVRKFLAEHCIISYEQDPKSRVAIPSFAYTLRIRLRKFHLAADGTFPAQDSIGDLEEAQFSLCGSKEGLDSAEAVEAFHPTLKEFIPVQVIENSESQVLVKYKYHSPLLLSAEKILWAESYGRIRIRSKALKVDTDDQGAAELEAKHLKYVNALEASHLRLVPMDPSGGHSLFRALSHQIFGTPVNHRLIRTQTFQHIFEHRGYFSSFLSKDTEIDTYLQQKRRAAEYEYWAWGDVLDLQATCEYYNVRLAVYSELSRDPLTPLLFYKELHGLPEIQISYAGNHHYDSLISTETQFLPSQLHITSPSVLTARLSTMIQTTEGGNNTAIPSKAFLISLKTSPTELDRLKQSLSQITSGPLRTHKSSSSDKQCVSITCPSPKGLSFCLLFEPDRPNSTSKLLLYGLPDETEKAKTLCKNRNETFQAKIEKIPVEGGIMRLSLSSLRNRTSKVKKICKYRRPFLSFFQDSLDTFILTGIQGRNGPLPNQKHVKLAADLCSLPLQTARTLETFLLDIGCSIPEDLLLWIHSLSSRKTSSRIFRGLSIRLIIPALPDQLSHSCIDGIAASQRYVQILGRKVLISIEGAPKAVDSASSRLKALLGAEPFSSTLQTKALIGWGNSGASQVLKRTERHIRHELDKGWDLLVKEYSNSRQRISAVLSVPSILKEWVCPFNTPLTLSQLFSFIPRQRLISTSLYRIDKQTEMRYIRLKGSRKALFFCFLVHWWEDGIYLRSFNEFPGKPLDRDFSTLDGPGAIQLVFHEGNAKIRLVLGSIRLQGVSAEESIERVEDLLEEMWREVSSEMVRRG